MVLSDSDIDCDSVTLDISEIRQGTRGVLSDRDMQHWRFLKSTCDTRTAPSRAPRVRFCICNDLCDLRVTPLTPEGTSSSSS